MNKSAIEDIVKRVYPQIAKDLGRSKKSTPKVEVHNNVLAMHSGIPDHPGGEEEHAEYDYKKNTIYLFKVALKTEQLVIQALLHEYTHACQDEKKYQAARAEGYANNPYEKAAHRAEKTWRKYMKKNESLNEIKKGDWIRSTYGDLGLVNKVKGQAAYVSFDGSRSFQPMRVADLKITKELHKGKVVYSEGIDEVDGTQVALPVDKPVVLRAGTDEHARGLIVTYKSSGGYDIQYWYGTPDKIVPAELKGDGKSLGHVKTAWFGYHPETDEGMNESLNEGSKANRWFDNLKYYYEKGLSSPDLKDPAEKKAYTKLAKQFFSKLREGLDERLKKGESGCCHKCGHSHVMGSSHPTPYKTGKNSCANRKTEDCGCGGAGRKDASIQLAEYLKKQTIEEADYQGRDVKLNKPMQGDVKKFKVNVKNAKGNVVKVNFGQKGMVIKKDNPGAKKSFRARHKCDQSKPKTSAGYWSCKAW